MVETNFDFSDGPHRRFNPLAGDWALVSSHLTPERAADRFRAAPETHYEKRMSASR